jgi:chitin disaccharide deacetylase
VSERRLIVNADDLGYSAGVNRGVARAHEDGIVTSASLMVRQPAADEAAAYARTRPALSVGLHVDLGEWRFDGGRWEPIYQHVDVDDGGAVAREVKEQLARFRDLLGREPTHLDSHQHVHEREPLRSVLQRVASELGVHLRHFDARVRYRGDFYGQTAEGEALPHVLTVETLRRILRSLDTGVSELCCHPGDAADVDSSYAEERPRELAVLCDPRVRATLEGEAIELVSFAALER